MKEDVSYKPSLHGKILTDVSQHFQSSLWFGGHDPLCCLETQI